MLSDSAFKIKKLYHLKKKLLRSQILKMFIIDNIYFNEITLLHPKL